MGRPIQVWSNLAGDWVLAKLRVVADFEVEGVGMCRKVLSENVQCLRYADSHRMFTATVHTTTITDACEEFDLFEDGSEQRLNLSTESGPSATFGSKPAGSNSEPSKLLASPNSSPNLSVYYLQLHTYVCSKRLGAGLRQCRPSLPHVYSFVDNGSFIFHADTGVLCWDRALVVRGYVAEERRAILYHYTSKEAFDAIIAAMELNASTRLVSDCDFGVGYYATAKEPSDFETIQDILYNNYPRATAQYKPGDSEFPSVERAAFCIPLLVDKYWMPAFPLTDPQGARGAIRETSDRYGPFDAAHHDIWLVDSKQCDKWVNADTAFGVALTMAARQGQAEVVEHCLKEMPNPLANWSWGDVMCEAASRGHVNVLELLLSAGAPVDAKSTTGWTALNCAAGSGYIDAMIKLVEARASALDATDPSGWTALMSAAHYGSTHGVRKLLAAKASVSSTHADLTAAKVASDEGHLDVVDILWAAHCFQDTFE